MSDFDREHVWHPYTSMTNPLPTYTVRSAHGVHIELEDGRRLIDGMSSWWCAIHGYNHPALNAAAQTQLADFAHVMFGGFEHAPANQLAKQLIDISPDGLEHVFFSDSGSVSVEVALKMAVQYWHNTGKPRKQRMLTIRGGYHGDTFGAMSVCDPENGMHTLFKGVISEQLFAPRPASRFGATLQQTDVRAFEQLLEQHHGEIAAVILEPIAQNAGGIWFYSAEYLGAIKQLCEQYDVLLILDEIATGFGRTGKMFAAEHAGIAPDIMCVGKSLTGGYVGLAATLTNSRVRDGISANQGVLMHGPTFMANALACSIASASIKLLQTSDWQGQVGGIEDQLQQELARHKSHPAVTDIRVLGAIGAVELKKPIDVAAAQEIFVAAGVWIRPFGKLAYLMPPYVIKPEELSKLTAAIGLILDQN